MPRAHCAARHIHENVIEADLLPVSVPVDSEEDAADEFAVEHQLKGQLLTIVDNFG